VPKSFVVQVALSAIKGGPSAAGEGWTSVSLRKKKTNDEIIQEPMESKHLVGNITRTLTSSANIFFSRSPITKFMLS
jgi:hypothetical protein